MKTIIDGLSVETSGKAGKRSIVFVHGFPFDKHLWKNQVEELKKNYYCIAYDVRGFGKSETGDGQFTMEKYASDLFLIINHLKLVKPVICGMSMGGYVCLRAVEKEPEKFGGLILIDTKAEADNDAVKIKRAEAIESINRNGVSKFVESFIPPLFSETTMKKNPALSKAITGRAKKHTAAGLKGALIAMLSRTDTSKGLKKLKIPTLVICGEEDKLTTPEVMRNMAGKIKNYEFVIIKEAGHMSPVENPVGINIAIKNFLEALQ